MKSKKVVKVPFIMQMEFLECGAACLDMILAYYGKWIPLEEVRKDCGVSRDGSNAKNMVLAARSYGLETKAYRMEPGAVKSNATFPCIIHWDMNHLVVLCGFKNNKAIINDPGRGTVKVPMEEFETSFTGIVMMFQPSETFEKGGKRKSVIAFVRKRLKDAKAAIAFVVISSVIAALIGIIKPAAERIFIDEIVTKKNHYYFDYILLFIGILAVFEIIIEWINSIYSLRINGKLSVIGSSSFIWKVLHLPMDFFSQRMAGDILSRQAANASVASSLVNTFAPLILNTGMMVFYFVVMLRYSKILTAIGLSSIIVDFVVSRIISKRRINVTRLQLRDSGKLAGTTISGFEMMETIKASGAENGFFGKWAGYQASENNHTVKFNKLNGYLGMIPTLVKTVTDLLITGIGIYLISLNNGTFTLGMLMAFQQFLESFMEPAGTLISSGQIIQEMRTSMERIEDVMEYPDDVLFKSEDIIAEGESYAKLSGDISIKNVTFGYCKLTEPLIKDFSVDIKKGSQIAIVGSSGCGKSTISKLISGLNRPWSGEILFDGKSIDEIDMNVFRGSLAVVDQDIILYEDTIGENISMWDKSIEDFELILAARDAGIYEDIMQRRGGFNYKILEGGKDFSGGQRQRLEIARVLAQDPTMIILDEATSALDAKTEYEVVKAIRERGITCIVVAHRLSTIRNSDEILVLDDGVVVERGTHDELMAMNGRYVELVTNE